MQHRRRLKLSVLATGMAILLSLAATGWSDSFPRITVKTLIGSPFVLPDQMEAAVNILVVGFTQKAGTKTRLWTERLRKDFTPANGFAVYTVAVLAGVPSLFRSLALGSVRSGIPEDQRDRFLIVDRDEDLWRRLTGYRLPDDPYIVALDKAGEVLIRASGPFNDKTYDDVASAIRSAAGGKQ